MKTIKIILSMLCLLACGIESYSQGQELTADYISKVNRLYADLSSGTNLDIAFDRQDDEISKVEIRFTQSHTTYYMKGNNSNINLNVVYYYGSNVVSEIEMEIKDQDGTVQKLKISESSDDKIELNCTYDTHNKHIYHMSVTLPYTNVKFGQHGILKNARTAETASQCMNYISQLFSEMNLPPILKESEATSDYSGEISSELSPYELFDYIQCKRINPDKKLFQKIKRIYIDNPLGYYSEKEGKWGYIACNKNSFYICLYVEGVKKSIVFGPSWTYTEISKDKIVLTDTLPSLYESRIDISVYRDAHKQKKYHITLYGSQESYEYDVDRIDYYDTDDFDSNYKISLREIMDSNKYTFLDYIKDFLQRSKFIINYK
jgi:hypothetical protein